MGLNETPALPICVRYLHVSQKISSSVRPHRHVSSMSLVELGKADSPSSPSSAIAILSLKAAGAVMTP